MKVSTLYHIFNFRNGETINFTLSYGLSVLSKFLDKLFEDGVKVAIHSHTDFKEDLGY